MHLHSFSSLTFFSAPSPAVQDGSETDIDCGGPACVPCSEGRVCRYDSDCDQTGSTTDGTKYPASTIMIVCSTTTLVCTDLRAGVQAYNAGEVPLFVAFSLNVSALPVSQFSASIVLGVESTIASTLNTLALPLITPSDVLMMSVRVDSMQNAPSTS